MLQLKCTHKIQPTAQHAWLAKQQVRVQPNEEINRQHEAPRHNFISQVAAYMSWIWWYWWDLILDKTISFPRWHHICHESDGDSGICLLGHLVYIHHLSSNLNRYINLSNKYQDSLFLQSVLHSIRREEQKWSNLGDDGESLRQTASVISVENKGFSFFKKFLQNWLYRYWSTKMKKKYWKRKNIMDDSFENWRTMNLSGTRELKACRTAEHNPLEGKNIRKKTWRLINSDRNH